MDYALDKYGDRIYPGDYVQCLTDQYFSIRVNARCRVKEVNDECIVLANKYSPVFDSPYRANNFRLAGRYHPYHHNGVDKRHPKSKYLTNSEKEKRTMLHIAIKVPDGWNYSNLAASINNWQSSPPGINNCEGKPITHPDYLLADTSLPALKERIKARIAQDPESRWLLLSGNTIAETSAPPVTYRPW